MTGVLRLSDDSFNKIVVKCCLRYGAGSTKIADGDHEQRQHEALSCLPRHHDYRDRRYGTGGMTRDMGCDQAAGLVAKQGAVVLRTGPTTYDRYIRHSSF